MPASSAGNIDSVFWVAGLLRSVVSPEMEPSAQGSLQRIRAHPQSCNAREITNYRDRYLGNLTYDPRTRSWRAAGGFVPHHASGAAEEYLESLSAFSLGDDPSTMAGTGPAGSWRPSDVYPVQSGVLACLSQFFALAAIALSTPAVFMQFAHSCRWLTH